MPHNEIYCKSDYYYLKSIPLPQTAIKQIPTGFNHLDFKVKWQKKNSIEQGDPEFTQYRACVMTFTLQMTDVKK